MEGMDMILPKWIPQINKPWNPGLHKTYKAMTPNDKRWSLLIDVAFVVAVFTIFHFVVQT